MARQRTGDNGHVPLWPDGRPRGAPTGSGVIEAPLDPKRLPFGTAGRPLGDHPPKHADRDVPTTAGDRVSHLRPAHSRQARPITARAAQHSRHEHVRQPGTLIGLYLESRATLFRDAIHESPRRHIRSAGGCLPASQGSTCAPAASTRWNTTPAFARYHPTVMEVLAALSASTLSNNGHQPNPLSAWEASKYGRLSGLTR